MNKTCFDCIYFFCNGADLCCNNKINMEKFKYFLDMIICKKVIRNCIENKLYKFKELNND